MEANPMPKKVIYATMLIVASAFGTKVSAEETVKLGLAHLHPTPQPSSWVGVRGE